MRKPTIAELRNKEVLELAKFDTISKTEEEKTAEARRTMNRFYRYVALRIRNFEDDNDERRQNTKWHQLSEAKEERILQALSKDIKERYNLDMCFAGLYPTLGVIKNHCIEREYIRGYYY